MSTGKLACCQATAMSSVLPETYAKDETSLNERV